MSFLLLLTLAPVIKGLIAMAIGGIFFPLCGVMVVRLNLIPLRYMLMHGVILGGALALALSIPAVPVTVAVNAMLVCTLLAFTKDSTFGFGSGSAGAMVLSMALASLIMHRAGVPAKDTLSLLWGSPFVLTVADIAMLAATVLILTLYIIANYRTISTLFFDQDVAVSMGLNVKLHYTVMVLIIALVIALAMKLLGALLIDALLVLPVITAARFISRCTSGGLLSLFVCSAVCGFIISAAGFILAVACNVPPSSTVALVSTILFFVSGRLPRQQRIK